MAPKVLIVEDEEALTLLLRYNLEAEGYEVDSVARGDEAEIRLRESAPDLVLLDWMLPGLSGIELCRRLRSRRDTAEALAVWRGDEAVDAVNNSLFRELLTYMMEDPRNITFCTPLLFCAKNIERMGDHATNIAETVHYMVEGRALADERPKGDLTSTTNVPYTGS